MATKPEIGTISLNEFSKRVGVTRNAVLKAIASGKIHGPAIGGSKKRPRIFEELAKQQWLANYAPRFTQSPALEAKLHNIHPATPQLEDELAAAHVTEENDKNPDDDIIKLVGGKRATMAEAKRVEAIHRSKIAELDLRERKGELIDKSKADKEYFAAGQVIRSAMQAIPDKHIDNILACQTRMEAHQILTGAIIEALESIVNQVDLK